MLLNDKVTSVMIIQYSIVRENKKLIIKNYSKENLVNKSIKQLND